jgi:hypothetical protein
MGTLKVINQGQISEVIIQYIYVVNLESIMHVMISKQQKL